MTLRHRLLLVYLIVVLLSVATVGVAVYELNRAQNIFGPLQVWHEVARTAGRLQLSFPPPQAELNEEEDPIIKLIAQEGLNLAQAADYLDVETIRTKYLFNLRSAYLQWKAAPPETRGELEEKVRIAIEQFLLPVDTELQRLNLAAQVQQLYTWLLPVLALGLAVAHVVVIGWLLRHWLLWPMEQLNRQVAALAKDQPPPEPLLTSPLEMANLAQALDQARKSLQLLRCQLIENERLTTIGQFAAQLAHNLRNPLASIRAAAQVTARHERENGYVCERMDEVVVSVDRLNHWVAGLMEVARREPTATRNEDVVPLLHRIGTSLKPELAVKELSLTVDGPAGGLICTHDPATLEQALIAMVVNAIEASPLGRAVILRAERLAPSRGTGRYGEHGGTEGQRDGGMEDGEMESDSKSEVCRISVLDEGPGLPPGDPERIFEFSYSTKQKGMGLGLALARLALERQGGEARARSRTEGGAMVYVDLPIADGTGQRVDGEMERRRDGEN